MGEKKRQVSKEMVSLIILPGRAAVEVTRGVGGRFVWVEHIPMGAPGPIDTIKLRFQKMPRSVVLDS